MFCSNCGKKVKESAEFCEHCGKPVKPGVVVGAVAVKEKPHWILAAMVVIVLLIAFWFAGVFVKEFPEIAKNLSNTGITYPVFCKDWKANPPAVQDFANCHEPFAYSRHVWKLDIDNDRVIETSPDDVYIHEFKPCVIQDEQHWSCQGSGAFGVQNPTRSGDRFTENVQGGLVNTIFVTEAEWASINNGAPSPQQ